METVLTSGRFRLSRGTHRQHLQEDLVVLCTPMYQAHSLRKVQDSPRLLHAYILLFSVVFGFQDALRA